LVLRSGSGGCLTGYTVIKKVVGVFVRCVRRFSGVMHFAAAGTRSLHALCDAAAAAATHNEYTYRMEPFTNCYVCNKIKYDRKGIMPGRVTRTA
jgi:hypothetical protein